MQQILQQENIGTIALRNLRKEKFAMGFPLMINVAGLPDYQCYFEYPDGSMSLVMLDDSKKDFVEIEKLSAEEAKQILIDNHLIL
jgi:hypothetical protein